MENFPGFPKGISGPELMDEMRLQSLRFGTEIRTETIAKLDLSKKPFRLWTESDQNNAEPSLTADSLIIATGISRDDLL